MSPKNIGMTTPRQQGAPQDSVKPHVRLALPSGRDKSAYVRLREDSAYWLEPWEPLLPGDKSPIDDEAFDRFYGSCHTETSVRHLIRLLATDEIVGQVSLNNIARGPFQSATLGYWIGAPYARKGYMSEAITLAVDLAFATLGLHRVEANIIPRNTPSINLVKKLGFRYEGTAERYLRIAGVWEDHERWAVTVEEWAKGTKPVSENRGTEDLTRSPSAASTRSPTGRSGRGRARP
jgi:[ribosomal protein S5]-alanine N-acetyltransferase